MTKKENELLTCMLAISSSDIEAMMPDTISECATYLGIQTYDYRRHYSIMVAKLRRQAAQDIIAEVLEAGVLE